MAIGSPSGRCLLKSLESSMLFLIVQIFIGIATVQGQSATELLLQQCQSAIISGEYNTWLGSLDSNCNCSLCDNVLQCCAFSGITAKIAAFEFTEEWEPVLAQFNGCTGATLTVAYPQTEDHFASFIKGDVGYGSEPGFDLYDAYVIQSPWIAAVNQGLMDFTPWIRNTSTLLSVWNNVNEASKNALSYDGSIKGVPMDTDYVAFGYRSDVFLWNDVPNPPESLEQLVDIAEQLNGKDHNHDGVADWGFCLTGQVNYFYAFVGSILQRKGCISGDETGTPNENCDNIFFDTKTFEPLIKNPGFKHAVKLFHRYLRASNCHVGINASTTGYCDRKTAFPTGRCAGVISMPGTLSKILGPDSWASYGMNDNLLAGNLTLSDLEGQHWGRRMHLPGAANVWDRSSNTIAACSAELCPSGVPTKDGKFANRATYFSEGGEAMAIRENTNYAGKTALVRFISWITTLPITVAPLSGHYSRVQLTGERAAEFRTQALEKQWPSVMISDLVDGNTSLLKEIFADNANTVQDFYVEGFSEYMNTLAEALLDNFLLYINESLTLEERYIENGQDFDRKYDEFVVDLYRRYNVVTEKYGRLAQLKKWRSSLGMAELDDKTLCTEGNLSDPMCTRLLAAGDGGPGLSSEPAGSSESNGAVIIVAVLVPIIVLLLVGTVVYLRVYRKKQEMDFAEKIAIINERAMRKLKGEWSNIDFEKASEYFDDLQLGKDQIHCQEKLGEGAFGTVYQGTVSGPNGIKHVAIKLLSRTTNLDDSESEAFLLEARLMASLKHPGIVRVEGIFSTGTPLMIAFELMQGGDLLHYLRHLEFAAPEPEKILALNKLGEAVAHLHSLNIVHRDIAARNVLVGEGLHDVRIADMGMSRRLGGGEDYYKKVSDDKVPVKWMPLEAIQFKKYSYASDVWSFAVMMWELFTDGQSPWASYSSVETVLALAQGTRLPKPSGCSDIMYQTMMMCWKQQPEDRPKMQWLSSTMHIMTQKGGHEEIGLSDPNNMGSAASAISFHSITSDIIQNSVHPRPQQGSQRGSQQGSQGSLQHAFSALADAVDDSKYEYEDATEAISRLVRQVSTRSRDSVSLNETPGPTTPRSISGQNSASDLCARDNVSTSSTAAVECKPRDTQIAIPEDQDVECDELIDRLRARHTELNLLDDRVSIV